MAWFSYTRKSDENTEPSRQNRQKCWDARDLYFECLDRVNVVKAGEEDRHACTKEKKDYEGNCASSWIAYFNQRRIIADKQKDLAPAKMQTNNVKS